jgi:hypothetical protein
MHAYMGPAGAIGQPGVAESFVELSMGADRCPLPGSSRAELLGAPA